MQQTESTGLEPIWQFVRLNDFRYPSRPVTETVRRGFSALLDVLWSRRSKQPDADSSELSLCSLDAELLASVAPGPDLAEPLDALSKAVDNVRSDILTIVSTPHNYTDAILREWATAHCALVLSPPTPDEIFSGEWHPPRSQDNQTGDVIVVPRLEKFFLRHVNGLDALRRFLDYIAGQNRRTIIAGDVSAWHYLRHAVQLDALTGMPIILDSFSAERLAGWYLHLSTKGGEVSPVFLEAGSGQTVLCAATADGSSVGSQEPKTSPFLDSAAWYTEGQPAVAWTLWRNSLLRANPGDESAKERISVAENVWVKPWKELPLPDLPASIGDKDIFLLALLLIHDGLDAKLAAEVAELPFAETRGILCSLQAMNLLDHTDGIWSISALAYPQIRRRLTSDGFLEEAFEVRR